MHRHIIPPPVDLSTRATEIASALGSSRHFLDAAQELLTCAALSPPEFMKHSRKIVALIEIARTALKAAGLSLYSFAECPAELAPFKEAYFELLRMLDAHQQHISDGLQVRAARLLSLLYPHCVIKRGHEPAQQRDCAHGPTSRPRPGLLIRPKKFTPPVARAATNIAFRMPPPDAFPPVSAPRPVPAKRKTLRRSPRFQTLEEDLDCQTSLADEDDQSENADEDSEPLVIRPHAYRFGIFCTPKRSMHQSRDVYQNSDRVGRSQAVRPIQRE